MTLKEAAATLREAALRLYDLTEGKPDIRAGARSLIERLDVERPMTLKEAAASLGITPDSLRQAIARGALRATKLGRDWIVTAEEVERYRMEHRRGARA